MKLSDMTDAAKVTRARFIEQLGAAGWAVETSDALLDIGVDVEPEARADRVIGAFDAALTFHASDLHLGFELVEREGDAVFVLRLYPRDQDLVLQLIIDRQVELDLERGSALIQALVPLCDPLVLEADGHDLKLS